MIFYLIFFISMSSSIFLTPYLITYLENMGVVDKPGKRRINTKIIPRMGGILLFSILNIIIFSFYEHVLSIWMLLFSSVLIIICGIIDDIVGLLWYIKFPIQFISASFIVLHFSNLLSNVKFLGIILPFPINYIILLFFIVGVLNSINMMDGLDGLVSGYSMVIFIIILVMSIIHYDTFLLITSICILGSLLGFLKFNAYPARIFLGDTGSLFLGFYIIIALFKVTLNYSNNILDLTFPFILLSIPIIDTLKVMVKRMLKNINPFMPDKTHLHHLIMKINIRHKMTVFIILGLSLFFVFISLFYLKYRSLFSILLFIYGSIIIIFMQDILKYLINLDIIKLFYVKYRKIAHIILFLFDKCLVYAFIPPILVIIIWNFPIKNVFPDKTLIVLLVSILIMCSLSYYHYLKTQNLNSIYVYFNIIFFLFFNYELHPYNNIFTKYYLIENILPVASLTIISIFEIIFLLSRSFNTSKKDMFFNGLDLTIIILTELIIILPNIIFSTFLITISYDILTAFLLFVFYKIIVYIRKDIKKYIFYISYLLPIFVIIYSFIFD